jgi:hypothetical protein
VGVPVTYLRETIMTPNEAKKNHGATHYSTMRDGVTPQMFYKQEPLIPGTNDPRLSWVYLSFANVWQGSDLNEDSKKHLAANLKPIDGLSEDQLND